MFVLLNNIDICNFADGTAAYVCDVNLKLVLEKLKKRSELGETWLEKNYINWINVIW